VISGYFRDAGRDPVLPEIWNENIMDLP